MKTKPHLSLIIRPELFGHRVMFVFVGIVFRGKYIFLFAVSHCRREDEM